MLSEPVVEGFSHFIYISTKLYLTPSSWNLEEQRFQLQSWKRRLTAKVLAAAEILFRIWSNVAYGYMLYRSLQNPSTVIQALLPTTFICGTNWCGITRYVSHAYRPQIEQFVNNFIELNAYLGKFKKKTCYKTLLHCKLIFQFVN